METINKKGKKDNFNEIIRNKLQNYSLPVSEDSWYEIEKRLNAKPGRRVVFWPWISVISVAAIITLVWLVVSLNKQTFYEDTTVQLSNDEKTVTERVFTEEIVSISSYSSSTVKQVPVRKINEGGIAGRLDFSGSDIINPQEQPLLTEKNISGKKELKEVDVFGSEELERIICVAGRKKNKSFGIHVGSGGSLYAMNNNSALNNLSVSSMDGSSLRVSSKEENTELPLNEFSKIVHRPPVSFGLSLRKDLTNWLSIESGLTYTYLYSTFENKIPQMDAKLELHYLGIPVNLVVSLYPNHYKKWNLYASAGGMVEKGLFSHSLRNEYVTGSIVSTTSDDRIDGLQLSLQAAIGIDYKIHRDYSIYFEPRINYYLDNNQPYNARMAHPLLVGINVGIRYTW